MPEARLKKTREAYRAHRCGKTVGCFFFDGHDGVCRVTIEDFNAWRRELHIYDTATKCFTANVIEGDQH